MTSTSAIKPSEKESQKAVKAYKVGIPMQITLVFSVSVESEDIEQDISGEKIGNYSVIDPIGKDAVLQSVVDIASNDGVIVESLGELLIAATKIVNKHTDRSVEIYYTPFAGVIPESKY